VTLRIGIYAQPLTAAGVELVRQSEQLGVDSVWVPEFWAADALTPLAYLAAQTSTVRLGTAIVQLGARTPAMLAMSARRGCRRCREAASCSASARAARR
jgi:alkanesulfonate monooxygenase SsuD/methylene tetrahydromethanopterin reductase-like flavin-dependent oxidoreductase (luciferase family)